MKRVPAAVFALFAIFGTTVATAHGGHSGEPPAPRQQREPQGGGATRERSDRSSNVQGQASGEQGAPAGLPRRRFIAPHGGRLTPTAQGYAEVVVDGGGNVSVWFLDRAGAIVVPAKSAFATIGGESPQSLVVRAEGDHLVGRIAPGMQVTLIVQADVGGRTTTVRTSTAR